MDIFKTALATLIFTLGTSSADAFEYSGLRSGMTFAEAQVALQHLGLPELQQTNMSGIYTVGIPLTSSITVTFCADRLFAISARVTGGVDAAAQMSAELVRQYGNPIVRPSQDYSDKGLLSMIDLVWLNSQSETITISLTSYQGRLAVTRMYSAFELLCQKP